MEIYANIRSVEIIPLTESLACGSSMKGSFSHAVSGLSSLSTCTWNMLFSSFFSCCIFSHSQKRCLGVFA